MDSLLEGSREQTGIFFLKKRKLARLITQYRDIFSNISEGPFRMTLLFNVTNLKYGKYDITSKKINNNKRLIVRDKK